MEKLVGIIVMENNIRKQLATGLTFGQANSMVVDLRSLRDGKFYWIGTLQ